MSAGYIYVLSNEAMPGLVKIGITNRSVKERVDELSAATGVPKPFDIEYYCLSSDTEEIEKRIQEHFASSRVPGREFFSATVERAVEAIDSFVKIERFCKRDEALAGGKARRSQSNDDIDLGKTRIDQVAEMLLNVNRGLIDESELPRNVAIIRRVLKVTNDLGRAISIARG